MATQVKKLRNYKTFANRGGVRKYMDRYFPEDAVAYVYRQDDDGRFYPVVVRMAKHAVEEYTNLGIQVDETIELV